MSEQSSLHKISFFRGQNSIRLSLYFKMLEITSSMTSMLQELDDVYHDACGVVAETLIQGADVMALKVSFSFLPIDGAGIETSRISRCFLRHLFVFTWKWNYSIIIVELKCSWIILSEDWYFFSWYFFGLFSVSWNRPVLKFKGNYLT